MGASILLVTGIGTITVTQPGGTGALVTVESVIIADQIAPAVGEFQIEVQFDPAAVDPASIINKTASVEVMIGDEAFPGATILGVAGNTDWTRVKATKWKFRNGS